MWITNLELRNIKSHDNSGVIPFAQGVNAIGGPNGAGKSTLLEAIGFALFDSLPYTQNQFLREGEKSGEVVVSFVDVLDEREYQIVRTVGASSIYIFDPEIQSKVVTGKADVLAWLKEHLGVDNSADLTALFEDSIGVPQGLLSAAFLERPAARKAKFDPLLQVDEYEEVWTRLREVARVFNEELETIRQDIAELTGELKQLPALEAEKSALESEITSRQIEQEKLQAEFESLEHELVALDTVQKRLQDIRNKVEALEARLQILDNQTQDAKSAVMESEKASEIVAAKAQAYESYLQAEQELEELEKGRSERDRLNREKNDLDKRIALARQRLTGIEASVKELVVVEEQIQELEPQVSKQEDLVQTFDGLQKRIAGLEAQSTVFTEEQEKLGSLEDKIKHTRAALDQANNLRAQQETVRQAVKTLELDIARLETDLAGTRAEVHKIRQHRSTLEESSEADCPICHQPLDTAHREKLLAEYLDQLESLEGRVRELDEGLEAKRKSLVEKQEEQIHVAEESAQLPDEHQLALLEEEYGALAASVEKKRTELEKLTMLREEHVELEQTLNELGDPKTKWSLLKAQLGTREGLLEEQDQLNGDLQSLTGELQKLDQSLEEYQALDEQISNYQKQRQDNQDAYRTFLANKTIAEQLDERQAHHQALLEELGATRQDLKEQSSSYESLSQDFDDNRYAEVRNDVIATSRELARFETIIEQSDERLKQLKLDISGLEKKQGHLVSSQQALQRGEETAEALQFIRTTIRNAGPFVTRALVQTISLEANRIFGEIMNDHTLRLMWNEDYSITLEQAGEQRDFSQLSGGEKTAAALSVRLALLRELSQIRVAFFDEPTSNLDDQRRENLASQITQITGFNQLFVISHDDTFERETDHVIHVEKTHGTSRVEVG
jgi:exonuclease SbcC